MKLSLLLSAYNGEKFILQQLRSLINQSRQLDEVVIIDDKSTDSTVDIVNKFILDNGLLDSWKLYINEQNKGWKRNFIEGIEKTTGDIFFFCDQDDIWFKDKVKVQGEIIENNADISVVASPEISKYDEGKSYVVNSDFKILDVCNNPKNYLNIMNGCSMAVRRNFYDNVKNYWINDWAHDQFMWQLGLVNDGLAVLKTPSLYRRLHENNSSKKRRDLETTIAECDFLVGILEHIVKYIKNHAAQISSADEKIEITNARIKIIQKRLLLLKEKKFSVIPSLIRDKYHIYWNRRQIFKDVLLAFKVLK